MESGEALTDRGGLEGILAAPFSGMVDFEFYPSLVQKAAKLVEGFALKQVFGDGNKRTGWLCMHAFLRANGLCLSYVADEVIDRQLRELIDRKITFEDLVDWLADLVIFPEEPPF